MADRRNIRRRIKRIISEEIGPGLKNELLSDMKRTLKDELDAVLMSKGIESKGLSKQQAALFYRELCKAVEDVLDDYSTIQVRDRDIRQAAENL